MFLKEAIEAGAVLRTDKQPGFMRLESRTQCNTIVAATLDDLYEGIARAAGYAWGRV
jgi:hypothetical protein